MLIVILDYIWMVIIQLILHLKKRQEKIGDEIIGSRKSRMDKLYNGQMKIREKDKQ
jgi:hypothetical protein